MSTIPCDVLIFGGGIAGMWLLDELHRRGHGVILLETSLLGSGQTIASQGILHGGLKYSLGGLIDDSSKAVAEMPARWRASLDGHDRPDLRGVRVLSPCCYMWRTDSLTSRAGLKAAQVVVRTSVDKVARADRPAALRDCPGDILRVQEQVIDSRSLIECLRSSHLDRLLHVELDTASIHPGARTSEVELTLADGMGKARIQAKTIVFSAGEGNAELRKKAGLWGDIMQRRPLHMVMVRGQMPDVFGHCIDGNRTRATITSSKDTEGETVWVVGGEIAEKGIELTADGLITHARRELQHVLPGVNFSGTQWGSYRINRAEALTPGRRRPEGVSWRREQSIITAWPTKLVLAPQLAKEIADALPPPANPAPAVLDPSWPRPGVAPSPWEMCRTWIT